MNTEDTEGAENAEGGGMGVPSWERHSCLDSLIEVSVGANLFAQWGFGGLRGFSKGPAIEIADHKETHPVQADIHCANEFAPTVVLEDEEGAAGASRCLSGS